MEHSETHNVTVTVTFTPADIVRAQALLDWAREHLYLSVSDPLWMWLTELPRPYIEKIQTLGLAFVGYRSPYREWLEAPDRKRSDVPPNEISDLAGEFEFSSEEAAQAFRSFLRENAIVDGHVRPMPRGTQLLTQHAASRGEPALEKLGQEAEQAPPEVPRPTASEVLARIKEKIAQERVPDVRIARGETHLSEREFEERYRPFDNPGNEGMRFFEGSDDEEAFLAKLPEEHIWTQLTLYPPGGGWHIIYVPGRTASGDGPIVTLRPWTAHDQDLIVDVETHDPRG